MGSSNVTRQRWCEWDFYYHWANKTLPSIKNKKKQYAPLFLFFSTTENCRKLKNLLFCYKRSIHLLGPLRPIVFGQSWPSSWDDCNVNYWCCAIKLLVIMGGVESLSGHISSSQWEVIPVWIKFHMVYDKLPGSGFGEFPPADVVTQTPLSVVINFVLSIQL